MAEKGVDKDRSSRGLAPVKQRAASIAKRASGNVLGAGVVSAPVPAEPRRQQGTPAEVASLSELASILTAHFDASISSVQTSIDGLAQRVAFLEERTKRGGLDA